MTLEEIGALLGFAAFIGLAVLIFLTFQQARHLRRLRDWAGRAPERAAAIASRIEDGRDEETRVDESFEEEGAEDRGPGRLERLREGFAARFAAVDRRSPIDPRLIAVGLVAVVAGVALATSGFGLFGETTDGSNGQRAERGEGRNGDGGDRPRRSRPTGVAVLNGTAPPGGTGVPGIAERVGAEVEAADFRVTAVGNAGSHPTSVVMYTEDGADDAERLAEALSTLLGTLAVEPMTSEIEAVADGADVALVVGQDDAGI
jgi:hypothetical protein